MEEVYNQEVETSNGNNNTDDIDKYADDIVGSSSTAEIDEQIQQMQKVQEDDNHEESEITFSVAISDPVKVQNASSSLPYWVYKVTVKTNSPRYKQTEFSVERRYSDFLWLQERLLTEHPACIVPPCPEKNVLGAVEKIFSTAVDSKQLVQYRQRALLKFLTRVVDHPILNQSQSLQQFLETEEKDFEQYKKIKAESKIPTVGFGLFRKQVTKEPEWITDLKTYITNLEEGLKWMKTKLQELVQRRKLMSASIADFAKGFKHLGIVEKQYEESTMSRSLIEISQKSEQLSGIVTAQADRETVHLVETFTYYLGVVETIRKVIKNLETLRTSRDDMTLSLKSQQATLEKLQKYPQGKEEKIKLQEQAVSDAAQKESKSSEDLKSYEDTFKEDIDRFDQERRVDFAYMLRSFTILQVEHSDTVKQHWESLLPSIHMITSQIENSE